MVAKLGPGSPTNVPNCCKRRPSGRDGENICHKCLLVFVSLDADIRAQIRIPQCNHCLGDEAMGAQTGGAHASSCQPSSCITAAARRCVATSSSWKMLLNLVRMPSGGPPSMRSRRSAGIPTEISWASDGGLDKATYVASHRSSGEKKRGNFQWKMRPGVAVTPCKVCSVLAVLMVVGSWRL